MKDFSTPRPDNIPFTIDDDTFYAVGDIPGGLIIDLGAVAEAPKGVEQLNTLMGFLDDVLLPESAARFSERLKSAQEPITFPQAIEVFTWLIEVYTTGDEKEEGKPDRPTREPSSSRKKSAGRGRSSTPSARSEGSTRRPPLSAAL
jgi:hypothetical protein